MDTKSNHTSFIPCTWQPQQGCNGCAGAGHLMCRFRWGDMGVFAGLALPFFAAAITGVLRAGMGRYLWGWLAYALFFFFVWEALILCRHCPYWAEDGTVLHCHANYGVVKLFGYTPRPMSRWEGRQFILGALLLLAYPLPFMLIGRQYALALLSLALAVYAARRLMRKVCTRCINFSCPLNGVPKTYVDLYLRRNPLILHAWQDSGYRLDEVEP